jgi:hypothetical protein
MDNLDILRAREEEWGREWEWLHDVIHRVAYVRAQQGETQMFRILQEQARIVGQRRVELRLMMAQQEGPVRPRASV